mmetsp:Transcript_39512/g.93604  ORF Transcript_39512/g.93604 Transcript_39512/m.93604 type:complete len:461 (+) Transcript_39512:156-1538(+)
MGVQLPATEHAVIVFSFCMAWCSVSTAAYMDVFVFAKTRKDYVTATEEFGMEPSMRAAVYSAFYLGWLFGDPLFGWIADKWGRHPSVYGAVALGFVFQASCALAIGQYSLFVLRFLAGMCIGGADLVAYVHCIELCTTEQRANSGAVMQVFFASGLCLSAAIAVVFPNWRQMYLAASVPLLFFLSTYFIVPESPRWLQQQIRSGKFKGSERISKADSAEHLGQHRSLLHISDAQQKERGINPQLDEEGLESLKKADNHEEFTYSQLLNDSGTSTTLLIACVIWMTSGFLYYGITLSAGSISDELHLNMFLMGIVEIPAYIVTPYLADNIGRKHSFMLFNVLAAFFCLVSWVYPRKQGRLLFALCGKICGSAVFSLCWIWAPEIFPTRARSLTTAIGSQAARVGSIVAPYVVVLMSEMSTGTIGPDGKPESPLPQPVFAVAAMSSLLFAYYLPETKDLDMI